MKIRKKKLLGYILFIIMIFQISAINYTASIYKDFTNNQESLASGYSEMKETFLSDTIRAQQKNMLSTIKQSWMKYLELNNDTLIEKDIDGYPIYIHNLEYVGYDSNIMYKEQTDNLSLYNIYEKGTGQLICEQAKPKWDSEKVEEILSVLVAPVKAFGNNGGVIVYDSNSGNIFLDTTPAKRLAQYNRASIFEDYKTIGNKNIEDTKKVSEVFLKTKKDSNTISNIVYMFNEPTQMGDDASDFSKYPLGKYNRQFIEMSVIPYETIGFDGQPMQLTILIVVDEKDITAAYWKADKDMNLILESNKSLYANATIALLASLSVTMIVMLVSAYILKHKINDDVRER